MRDIDRVLAVFRSHGRSLFQHAYDAVSGLVERVVTIDIDRFRLWRGRKRYDGLRRTHNLTPAR